MSEKEITMTNIMDTLMNYVSEAVDKELLDLYNRLTDSDYKFDDVDWEN